MANDSAISYQNIQLDNLDELINITFSMPPPLNPLVTKRSDLMTLILKNMIRPLWII